MNGRRRGNLKSGFRLRPLVLVLGFAPLAAPVGCGTLGVSLGSLAGRGGASSEADGFGGESARCVSDEEDCASSEACCSQNCLEGTCAPLNTSCKTSGNKCSENGDCCSSLCDAGTCSTAGSFCSQPGDACVTSAECCTGSCLRVDTASLGVCDTAPAGPASCTGLAGLPCGTCGDCCSRLCAPFGPLQFMICQLPSGCRMTGEVCQADADCCGGDESSDVAGAGNGSCEKATGETVGICRNVQGCSPQGNACHLLGYSCSVSAAANKCCDGTASGACELDESGAPRCTAQAECKMPGETCATRMDCCDLNPCGPNSDGRLVCTAGAPSCARVGEGCTATADCCSGALCRGSAGGLSSGHCQWPESSSSRCSFLGQTCDSKQECCAGTTCTEGLCEFDGN